MSWAELAAATNFSFLRGASEASDMVGEAHRLGYSVIGIADRNTVAGVVRAFVALRDAPDKACEALRAVKKSLGQSEDLTTDEEATARTINLRLIVGARLVFADGTPDIIAYPRTRNGWGNLTRMLTQGNLRSEKGGCILRFDDLIAHREDLLLIVLPASSAEDATPISKPLQFQLGSKALRLVADVPDTLPELLKTLSRKSPNAVWLGMAPRYDGRDKRHFAALAETAQQVCVPVIAIGDVLYATAEDRQLHDVVTCIRLGTTINQAGSALQPNAERYLKAPFNLIRLFSDYPEAISETKAFAQRIAFSLEDLRYEYPHEPVPPGWSPMGWLVRLTMRAARKRYGPHTPPKVRKLLKEEFELIRERDYPWSLT